MRSFAWLVAAVLLALTLRQVSGGDVARAGPPLRVSGGVEGLVPGAPAALQLTVSNPGDTGVIVRTVSARVTSVSPGCRPSALLITPWRGEVAVAPGGRVAVSLDVGLAAPAIGCETAVWGLTYSTA